ncbi:hypothetical protein WJX79_002192 [Trebouxia sp. C0005]
MVSAVVPETHRILPDGRLKVGINLPLLARRFRYLRLIGEGTSAQVILAEDTHRHKRELVVIKVLKRHFAAAGHKELRALRLHRSEALHNLKKIATQLLGCLALMHSKGVVHADIKPENILLTSPPESGNVGVKLIDLGNCFSLTGTDTSRISFEMQTLPFRAPEALTGGACGAGIDVWSLGCVLAEVALQRPLFPITTISELMHQMTAQLGPLPPSLRSLLPAQASPIMVAQAAPPIHESAHKGTDSVQTSRWAHGQQNPIPGHAQDAEQDPGEESVQGLQQTLGQSAQGAVQTPGVVRAWNGVTRLLQEMTPGSEIRPPPPRKSALLHQPQA